MSRSAGDNESLDVWGGVQTVTGGLLEEVEGEPRWGGWRLEAGVRGCDFRGSWKHCA